MVEVEEAHAGATANLCQACQLLNVVDLTSPEGQIHVLQNPEPEACPLCEMIYSNPDFYFKQKNSQVRLKLFKDISNTGLASMVLFASVGGQWLNLWIASFTDKDDWAAVKYDVPTFRILTTSGSTESMDVAKRWLRHCLDNHSCYKPLPGARTTTASPTTCQSEAQGYVSPSRLIDTKAFDEQCLDVQLIEELDSGVPYATLSHCWGPNAGPEYRTTIANLERYTSRIRYRSLPASFRDAIAVCRAIEIRYLWIDTLCIIQDSTEDRQREVALMADIYGNSLLTISADWSPGIPEVGCFNLRKEPQRLRMRAEHLFRVTNTHSDGNKSSLYFSQHYEPGHEELDRTALSRRAWAYQERLLSRRNLHFMRDQLFWECRQAFAGKDLVPRSPGVLRTAVLLKLGWADTEKRLHIWYLWIVTAYSSGNLTLPKDRLPAISAVARIFHHHLRTPYLAGLWLEGLWYGLSWYVQGGVKERPDEYIAPSWSWAAVNREVNWLIQSPSHSVAKKIVDIEDTEIDHDGDPYSYVHRGWIRIRGPLVMNVSFSGPEKIDVDLDNLQDADLSDFFQISKQRATYDDRKVFYRYRSPFLDEILLDFEENPPLRSVDCLLLGEDPFKQCFLLLTPTTEDRSLNRRVGMGIRWSNDAYKQWPEQTLTII